MLGQATFVVTHNNSPFSVKCCKIIAHIYRAIPVPFAPQNFKPLKFRSFKASPLIFYFALSHYIRSKTSKSSLNIERASETLSLSTQSVFNYFPVKSCPRYAKRLFHLLMSFAFLHAFFYHLSFHLFDDFLKRFPIFAAES